MTYSRLPKREPVMTYSRLPKREPVMTYSRIPNRTCDDLLQTSKERTCDDLLPASKERTCDDLLQASKERNVMTYSRLPKREPVTHLASLRRCRLKVCVSATLPQDEGTQKRYALSVFLHNDEKALSFYVCRSRSLSVVITDSIDLNGWSSLWPCPPFRFDTTYVFDWTLKSSPPPHRQPSLPHTRPIVFVRYWQLEKGNLVLSPKLQGCLTKLWAPTPVRGATIIARPAHPVWHACWRPPRPCAIGNPADVGHILPPSRCKEVSACVRVCVCVCARARACVWGGGEVTAGQKSIILQLMRLDVSFLSSWGNFIILLNRWLLWWTITEREKSAFGHSRNLTITLCAACKPQKF